MHRLERADSPLTSNSNYRFLLVNHNCSTAGPPLPADLARLQCHFPAVVVLCRPVQLQPEHGQTYTDRTEEQNISTHFSSSLLLRILLEDFCPRIDSPVFPWLAFIPTYVTQDISVTQYFPSLLDWRSDQLSVMLLVWHWEKTARPSTICLRAESLTPARQ